MRDGGARCGNRAAASARCVCVERLVRSRNERVGLGGPTDRDGASRLPDRGPCRSRWDGRCLPGAGHRARPEGRPDADLANGEIRVEVAFDFKSKIMVDPKSESSVRVVPIDGALRDDLVEHRMRNGRNEGLVFGRSAKKPFSLSGVTTPARRVWLAAGLEPVTLHECRHCFTSTMLAAGVDVPTIAKYLGHSSTELIPTRRYPPPGGG